MKLWRSATSRAPIWVAALWWGSLSTIGLLVVPLLFVHLPAPAMAGAMAAKLFTAQTWVSSACALFLLLSSRTGSLPALELQVRPAIVFIVSGMLLALLSEFAVAPRIIARENLKLWHSLGSAMYLLQWLCAAAVLWRFTAPGMRDQV